MRGRARCPRGRGLASLGLALSIACAPHEGPAGVGGAGSSAGGTQGSDAAVPPRPREAGPRTYAQSFSAIWKEILEPSCAWLYCHGGSGLHLELPNPEAGYASLLEPAEGHDCAPTGLRRIEPGSPSESLVLLKVGDAPPCGQRMPVPQVAAPLTAADLEQLSGWIAAGAPYD